ncbi:MAG: helix-turn-helix transcriptional regulator [Acidobacteria bacterium]|nr:helix-turn-helix transcriptional regulator [Acidobacteriota bacterium]
MRHPSAADHQRLERAVDQYLRYCYRLRTAARVSELAEQIGISAAYLSRTTSRITGQPVREYLRERQLRHAARLLRETPLTVDRIALAGAFGTVSTFYRCFVDKFRETPASYRARFRRSRALVTLLLPSIPLHPERRAPFL